MGEIIPLRPRQGAMKDLSTARTIPVGAGEGAMILLFTGVRYERHEEAKPAKTPRPAGRGGRRKRA
jgi:hypothetical protein